MTTSDADTPTDRAPAASDLEFAVSKPPRRKGSAPGWLVWTMIVLASLVAVGGAMNSWLNRQLLDTDNWVDVSDDLLSDDEVRGALSIYLVNELFTYVDVSEQLQDRLPDQLQVLAGPISAALRQPAIDAVDRVLDSPQVQEVWREANRVAHTALVNILKGDTRESVDTADGVVTLNLSTVVKNLGQQLGLPQGVLDRIPADAGVITIADSEQLAEAQDAVSVVEKLNVVLLVVVILLYAAAVFVASDRRATVRNVGIAVVVTAVVLLVARQIGIRYLSENIRTATDVRSAIHAAALIGTNILNEIAWLWLSAGVLLFIWALLMGPTRAARATRRGLSPILSNRLTAFIFAIAVIALIVWITPGSSVQTLVGAVTLLVLVVVGVERLRSLVRREHPDTSLSDVGHDIAGWFGDGATVTTPKD
ncbi:MAG: hypothetical protein ABWZ42_11465 [Ilumatobacteraceae bacterium]